MKCIFIWIKFQLSFFIFIIISLNISNSKIIDHYNFATSLYSKITIYISGQGPKSIISSLIPQYPDSIIINKVSVNLTYSETGYKYNLVEKSNIIDLIWNYNLSNCSKMFSGCGSINEIHLTQFIGSDVKSFSYMFEDCISLSSLVIFDLDTSSANDMSYMFANCSIIEILELSSFDTNQVTNMDYMFSGCRELNKLYLSNINSVETMTNMFSNCYSLRFVDLNYLTNSSYINYLNVFEDPELNIYIKQTLENGKDYLFLFKNKTSIINHYIYQKIPDLEEYYEKIEKNLRISREKIITAYLEYKYPEQGEILFFDISSGEKINIENYSQIIDETQLISESVQNLNFSKIISEFDGNSFLFNDNKKTYQISYLKNQMQNLSVVNLGYCEDIIKEENRITEDLIIFKTEYSFPEFQIPIIEFEIYDKQGNKLSLDSCSNTSINYEIPVTINENEIYKYDPNSFYYNDKCHPVESDKNTDMTIYDRKNEFNEHYLSLCQTDCSFKGYNTSTKKAICKCSIKTELPFEQIFNVDKDILIKKFLNVKDLTNIEVIKCYRLIFYENGLQKNFGSYIIISILLIIIVGTIILSVKEFNNIKIMLDNILQTKMNINNDKNSEIQIFKKIKNVNNPIKKKTKNKLNNNANMKSKSKSNLFSLSNIKDDNLNKNKSEKVLETKKDEIIISEQYNDFEINNLSYEKAKINDNRTYWQYYLSLIKTKQLVIFSFYLSTDYNLRTIKINLFFLTFALNLTVNALFFNDSTMHKIYKDEGNYNFVYQLPQIIYSLLITVLIKTSLSLLSLTEKSIVKIKEKKELEFNMIKKEIKCIKTKLIIFFVLEFIFLVLFWYYLSCFCALYKNTQSHLVKDTLTSFALSLLYPFALNLIPGIFRISSLKSKNNDSKFSYTVSKVLQLI